MKPERINEIIAEHCGALTGWICPNCGHLEPEQVLYAEECESCLSPVVNRSPDYCNDLNAMREARKTLRQIEQHRFVKHLRSTLHLIDGEITLDYVFSAIDAPANQQAEAFVKAINKWEEVER